MRILSLRPPPLQYLAAFGDRPLIVGKRFQINAVDSADRTINAGVTVYASVAPNTIVPGVWTTPPPDAGVIFEKASVRITTPDNAGLIKLFAIGWRHWLTWLTPSVPLPYTFPAIAGIEAYATLVNQEVCLPVDEPNVLLNGPSIQVIIQNLDTVNSHTYRLTVFAIFRYVSNVFQDGSTEWPGSQELPEGE